MQTLKKYFDFSYAALLSAFLILAAVSIGLFFVFSKLEVIDEENETQEKKFQDYESALIAVSIGIVLAVLVLFGFKQIKKQSDQDLILTDDYYNYGGEFAPIFES